MTSARSSRSPASSVSSTRTSALRVRNCWLTLDCFRIHSAALWSPRKTESGLKRSAALAKWRQLYVVPGAPVCEVGRYQPRVESQGGLRQEFRAALRRVRGPKVVARLVRSLILMWSIDLEPGSVRGESQKCKQDDAAGSADAAADAAGSGGARERDGYRARRRWGRA